jgi:3-dehydroquinate synthase
VETISLDLGPRSYPIHIGPGLLGNKQLLAESIASRQILVVTNDVVAPLYLDTLLTALPGEPAHLVLRDGERYKTLDSFTAIINRLVDLEFHRDAALVALGGGVIGDIAGFAAASYQRGIDFVQAPTTLLAQVDSSVGGKTAVNHPRAKNMIGAFYQPRAVLADTATLATLPEREFSAGLAEVIKYGLIVDLAFFEWLETSVPALRQLDEQALPQAIRHCCEIKADIVAADEREAGKRALLNLGHTFGHALEAIGDYGQWLHGEAVAIGTSIAARVSHYLGMLSLAECERIDSLLRRAGLPVRAPNIDPDELLAAMQLDKKRGSSGLRVILLAGIGEAVIRPAPAADALRAIVVEHSLS